MSVQLSRRVGQGKQWEGYAVASEVGESANRQHQTRSIATSQTTDIEGGQRDHAGSDRGASGEARHDHKAAHDLMPENPSTRDRLIETARQLFLAKGYEATGVSEILRESSVNSGSLYYFFKKKEDLLLAVLDRYAELLEPVVIAPIFEQESDPIERVFGVLAGYRMMLIGTECRQGCPIGNLALEMSEKSDGVRKKISLNLHSWCKVIQRCFEDAADRLPTDVNCARLATFALTVMEGGVMQARAHRSIDPFDESVAMFRDYIERLLHDGEQR